MLRNSVKPLSEIKQVPQVTPQTVQSQPLSRSPVLLLPVTFVCACGLFSRVSFSRSPSSRTRRRMVRS